MELNASSNVPLSHHAKVAKKKKKKDGGGAIFCHFRALSLWLPFKFSFTSQGLWKLYTSYNMQSVSMCLVPERRAELRS